MSIPGPLKAEIRQYTEEVKIKKKTYKSIKKKYTELKEGYKQ